ncbi:MAG: GH3 auxin-responsive promoter family protein [Saprospiraceae bacterium]|nr:GH3 auxin-responsive promoter family protein [Saprospiraceae bacterium]
MSIIGSLIRQGTRLGAIAERKRLSPVEQQHVQLFRLLNKARNTAYGRFYGFQEALYAPDMYTAFRRQAPATDYQGMYDRWWSQAHQHDMPDICWPGQVPYFALSSGTSQSSTKYLPLTEDMIRGMKRGSRRLFFNMRRFGIPDRQYTKQMLMVGSCTRPVREGQHWTGDLSGILGLNRPLWLEPYYRPGRLITDLPEWSERIERIATEAPGWDIGFAVSNPMWLQLILERILEKHRLQNIHEIWPDFSVFVHGGVFFEPYQANFEQLLGRPVQYINSYMASEGFFACQNQPGKNTMQLLTDCGVFYEFVPFNAENFDENGDLRSTQPVTLTLDQVQPHENYALLISTSAGAWRYLLGDTLRFTDTERCQVQLTGRTKQYLSVCGEHLSIDNLNEAVRRADARLSAGVREFTVAGVSLGSKWAHQWYVSVENKSVTSEAFAQAVDQELCILNDDYAIERKYALQEVRVRLLSNEIFLKWLEQRGKLNGQAKIPRVLKAAQLNDFEQFMKNVALVV